MDALYIGVDAGSSGCKVVAIDGGQQIVASMRRPYSVLRGFDGSCIADVGAWTVIVKQAVHDCLRRVDAPIAGISFTAPAHHLVVLDEVGAVLAPMLTAADRRPVEIANELGTRYGSELFDSTWVRMVPGSGHAQLAWLAREYPEIRARARWILPFKDYLRGLLTGDRFVDPTDAAGTGLWSQRDGRWEAGLIVDLGVRATMPDVLPSLAIAGVVGREAARDWGVPVGTPVAVGATDTAAELLSLPEAEHVQLVKLATTGTVVTVTGDPAPAPTLLTYPHARPNQWYQLGVINNAASAADVIAGIVGFGTDDIALLHEAAASVRAGSEGLLFIPSLDGERTPYWDARLRASFLGLTGAHRREHLFRATLEGVAFALADAAKHMESLGRWQRLPTFITGGGAASVTWSTIVASVFGQTMLYADNAGPAVGSAWIARIASGAIDASASPSLNPAVIRPDESWAHYYHGLQPIYEEAVRATQGISHLLATFVEGSPL